MMGTRFIHRIIPMQTLRQYVDRNPYTHVDENQLLLQACYENPLFEEDGTVIHETQTKLNGQVDGLQTKPYNLPNAAQTSVHYRQSKSRKRRALCIVGFLLAVITFIAVIAAIIAATRNDGSSLEPSKSQTDKMVLFKTKLVVGSVRIIQGPFSSYQPEYSDKSSTPYSLFSSSFTYQMNSIFSSSNFKSSFSHTEIVNISSGSVIVHFMLHFHDTVDIYHSSAKEYTDAIVHGFSNSLFLIDPNAVRIVPEDPALSVITTSKPGVCVSITSSFCAGFSNWSTTTFPNLLGHRSPAEVAAAELAHEDLFVTSCGRDFWCAVFNPPCFRNKALPPCRKYCKIVFSSCGGMYPRNINDLMNCEDLPDSSDPSICNQDPFKPGQCLPNKEDRCQHLGYNSVGFPNFAGMRSPYQASELIQLIDGINTAAKCYKHSLLFACTAFMPKCSGTGQIPYHAVPPCRSLCTAFKSRCEIFLDIFWQPWPQGLYCDTFPDKDDPNVCLGYKEAREIPALEDCTDGESRCDNSTCIPFSWRCDGFNDCKDGTDETAIQSSFPLRKCVDCPTGMFRCSFESAICLETSRRCDGVEDCPTAADERDCVKLDDGGREGVLSVYNHNADIWAPVCSTGWTSAHSEVVCCQLGYQTSSFFTTSPLQTSRYFAVSITRNGTDPRYISSDLVLSNSCSSGTVVKISCGLPVCGIRPAFIRPAMRVVGGIIADPNAWPWHISIFGGYEKKYFCGGTIIDEKWILTAGHCIGGHNTVDDMLIRAGQPRRDTFSPYLQELIPAQLYLHPEYNAHTVANDIALIRLKNSIKFNDHVRPACLPKTDNRLPVGTRCTVYGWGKQGDAALDYERQIREVNLEVTDWTRCKHSIENAEIKVPYKLTDQMFCAGGGLGHDSCSGDSGGPFMCSLDKTKDTWFVAGIVSWGVACALPNVPGVYTNVPGFIDWIHNVTGLDYL